MKKRPPRKTGSAEARAEALEAEIAALKAKISEIETKHQTHELAWKTVSAIARWAKDGDDLSLALVFMLANEVIGALGHVADQKPERLWPLSQNVFTWPAYISRKRAFKQSNGKLIKALRLGEGGMYSSGGWQPAAPSTGAAIMMLTQARHFQEQWGLPVLTKKTKKQWFKRAWCHILELGVVPEESPLLAPLGKSAIGKKSTNRGMSEQTEGMKRDDVRAEIKRQLWRAFDKLVSGAQVKPLTTGDASS